MRTGRIVGIVAAGLLISGAYIQAAPFTAGNLAVLRLGNGSETLAGNAVSAWIDEYTSAGSLVQSIGLPTSGSSALTSVGNGSRDGIIQLTQNGQSIVLGGYRAD